jgi:prepilin-type N-terminal cleavage/methylation domain-containing protein/prepilin-type processing-associated H-X9-DG protein
LREPHAIFAKRFDFSQQNGFGIGHAFWHPTMKLRAFTLLELVLVIAIITILVSLLLPAFAKARSRADRFKCVNNLKEIGMGFHLFANDHHGRLPMEIWLRDGGSREFVPGGNAFKHFQSLSNEIVNPRLLICPVDSRVVAGNWNKLRNSNVSYFVALEPKLNISQSLFSGDRNVSQTETELSNVLQTTYTNVQWTTNLHNAKGNLLFGDGRVSQVNNEQLREALQLSAK